MALFGPSWFYTYDHRRSSNNLGHSHRASFQGKLLWTTFGVLHLCEERNQILMIHTTSVLLNYALVKKTFSIFLTTSCYTFKWRVGISKPQQDMNWSKWSCRYIWMCDLSNLKNHFLFLFNFITFKKTQMVELTSDIYESYMAMTNILIFTRTYCASNQP